MLPSLSPLSGASTGSVQVPPPPKFKPISGMVLHVHECEARDAGEEGLSASQRQGLRYEKRVHSHLLSLYPENYCPSPVLAFYDGWGRRFCIPDGIVAFSSPRRMFIFEFKYQHMPEAWWQLRQLYQPVVQAWRGSNWSVSVIEVCRTFDPATPFPEPVQLIDDLGKWTTQPRAQFGVYRWR